MKCFRLIFAILLLSTASTAAARASSSFQALNGVMWFYTSLESRKFSDIKNKLDLLKSRGIRVIGIYSPYHGDKNKWYGCAPVDFYDVSPQSGRMQDFRDLVAAAHQRDMKVVAYFTNIFLDRNSTFFKRAEQQFLTGDRSSREVSTFRWSTDKSIPIEYGDGPFTDPEGDNPRWLYSRSAKAHYWSIWGEPALDFNLAGAKAEGKRLMEFWLDTGLDGFMFDAGVIDEKFKYLMVDLVKSHTRNDKWITFESTDGEQQAAFDRFGLTSWFNLEDNDHVNDYALVVRGKSSMNDLEEALQRADYARARGKTTHAWAKADADDDFRSMLASEDDEDEEESEDEEEKEEKKPYSNEPVMRVQEAALLAGAGMLYGSTTFTQYESWPVGLRSNWDKVLVTVNANRALLPTASRKRVAVDGKNAYAMVRKSADGAQTALLAYNFSGQTATLTLKLDQTGISLSQTPRDLYNGGTGKPIQGASYSLVLPPYGFRILDVSGK